jgi:hypothetical protein
MKLTKEKLVKYCTTIYGAQWQTPFAKDIGYSNVTVSRWATGETKTIPAERIVPELIRLARYYGARKDALANMLEDIYKD